MGSPPLYAGVLSCDSDFAFRMQFLIARLHGLPGDERATSVFESASAGAIGAAENASMQSAAGTRASAARELLAGASDVDDPSAALRAPQSFHHAGKGARQVSESDGPLLVRLMPSGAAVARQ